MKTAILLLFCALSATSLAQAGVLQWETTEQVITSRCGQAVVEAVYPFRNTSDRPVRILKIKSSCECLSVTALPEICAPGAKGEVRATFTLGERIGEQRREILVRTDAAPDAPDNITIVVKIPAWVTLMPRLIWWDRDAPAEEKRTVVQIADTKCCEILKITCDNPAWEVRKGLFSQENGTQELLIRPLETKAASRADISVTVRLADQEKIFRIFTAVK